MKFTCIMATFNDGDLIRQSVASILNQSYENFELLIVDDGSSSPTAEIVSEMDDPRVKVLPQANAGLSAARNRGLHHASGDYICFLDADDTRAPWAFAQVASLAKDKHPDLVLVQGIYSQPRTKLNPFMDDGNMRAMQVEEKLDQLTIEARKAWATSYEPQSANKFISRKLLERGKLRFPNDHFFEDILFHIMTIAHATTIEFVNTPSFTYFHRQIRAQLTTTNGQTRFDILGTARVAFQLFERHSDFSNIRQRGAASIGILRLLKWCENELPAHHRYGYRLCLREVLRGVNPLYFVIDESTPDPRHERKALARYAREVIA